VGCSDPGTYLAWSPEQATGEPNTPGSGDCVSAWASLTPDEADEWLIVRYAAPVAATAIHIHETFHPGAVVRIASFENGKENVLWAGEDPVVIADGRGVAEIPVDTGRPIAALKIFIDSKAVFGWNEIDAVGLLDASGTMHWATEAEASSTYAELPSGPELPPGEDGFYADPYIQRIEAIEKRLEALEK
jgi:hypothetical protein